MFRKYLSFKFGQIPVEELFKAIFTIGLLPINIIVLMQIPNIGTGLLYMLRSQDTVRIFIYGFILLFFILVTIVAWKLFCELLFLVFKSMEVFIKKNQ